MALGRIVDPKMPFEVQLVCEVCREPIEERSPIDGHEACLDAEGCLVIRSVAVDPSDNWEPEGDGDLE